MFTGSVRISLEWYFVSTETEYINIAFHSKASDLFFSLYEKFQSSIKTIDREKEEYIFQQMRERYVRTLQQQLEMAAKDIIKNNQGHKQLNQVDQNLNLFIKEYLHRFVQKIKEWRMELFISLCRLFICLP